MSDSNSDPSDVSRRSILKKSAAGATTGLAGLSHVAPAWAKPSQSELEQLADRPNVQAILGELGRNELPGEMKKVSSSLGEDAGELEIWRGELGYGTLHVGRLGDLTNVVFQFEQGFRSAAPKRFQSIPEGTDPIVTVTDGDAIVKRSATDREREAIRSALPVTGSSRIVYTATNIEGFRADVFIDTEGTDTITQRRYRIDTTRDDTHPVFHESSGALERTTVSNITAQTHGLVDDAMEALEEGVETDAVKGVKGSIDHRPFKQLPDATSKIEDLGKRGIKNVVLATIAGESAEALAGDCGEDCVDCALSIQSLITDCPKCCIFLTTSVSAVGAASAILLIVCMWHFCNVPKAINNCDNCLDCAT